MIEMYDVSNDEMTNFVFFIIKPFFALLVMPLA